METTALLKIYTSCPNDSFYSLLSALLLWIAEDGETFRSLSTTTSKSEFVETLRLSSATTLAQLRCFLFDELKQVGLAESHSLLVRRTDTPLNPAKEKHVDDIWRIVQCLKRKK